MPFANKLKAPVFKGNLAKQSGIVNHNGALFKAVIHSGAKLCSRG